MCPAMVLLCKQKLPVTPDRCSRFCYSGKKNPNEVFQIFRGASAWERGEKGHTILFPGLDKSRCVPLSYVQYISVMNIWLSNLSTSSPWQCSAISSAFCRSKHKLLVLISVTSPHSAVSQFIMGCWLHGPITPGGVAHL